MNDHRPNHNLDDLRAALLRPSAYPEPTSSVSQLETHISCVFLTDRFVYKLKKPVRFDFLDFSTPERRRAACLAEVELNRRLAKDVYLDVVPITDDQGTLTIAGTGPPVDWLIKMRRLNDADTLLSAIRRKQVSSQQITSVATTLAQFYRQQPPLTLSPQQYRQQIADHIRGNLAELRKDEQAFPESEVRRTHAQQLIYLTLHADVFDERIAAGRVLDGHGDLRPEHIYLTQRPTIIDCIEFSAEFRTVDVLDELSFLETECAMLDAAEIGAAIRRECGAQLNDEPPPALAAFYRSYRACVRAKVAVLRARQTAGPTAEAQWNLARRYLHFADITDRRLGPPLLLLVCGISGTGKSTVAKALADKLALEVLQTDAVRQTLVEANELPADKQEKYTLAGRERVYEAMLSQADQLLAMRSSVILDGTFLSHELMDKVAALAARHQAQWLIVHCHCPPEVAKERIAARLARGGSRSEAEPDLVDVQTASEPTAHPDWPWHEADTTQDVPTLMGELIARLQADARASTQPQ